MTVQEQPTRETPARLGASEASETSGPAGLTTALAALRTAKPARPTRGGPLTRSRWLELLREREGRPFDVLDAPIVALGARHPWGPEARLDVFRPARWDTTYDLVFMSSDSAPDGPSIGYVDFVAPADGVYLVGIRFSGHETSLRLSGPWGLASTESATTGDHPTVTAVWTGALGSTLHFTFSFAGGLIGTVEEVVIHELS